MGNTPNLGLFTRGPFTYEVLSTLSGAGAAKWDFDLNMALIDAAFGAISSGTMWWTGVVDPTTVTGAHAGDFYLNTATGTIWRLESSVWNKKGALSSSPILGTPSLGKVPTGQGDGTAVFSDLPRAAWPLSFPVVNPKIITVAGHTTANGQNAFYTVPAGRRAMWINLFVLNISGANATVIPRVQVGSSFFALTGGGLINNNVNSQFQPCSLGYIAEAGESFSIESTSTPGQPYNFSCLVFEFDSSSNTASSKIDPASVIAGNNTIFTCPAGFKAVLSFPTIPIGASGFGSVFIDGMGCLSSNISGATRTYNIYIVPNGGSPSSSNQLVVNKTLNNLLSASILATSHVLSAGDSVVVNSDSSAAGQLIWVTYCFIPATD